MPKQDTTGGGIWPLRRVENAVARLAATSRRVEITTPGLVFSTPGLVLSNPGLVFSTPGLVDPIWRPVFPKIGA